MAYFVLPRRDPTIVIEENMRMRKPMVSTGERAAFSAIFALTVACFAPNQAYGAPITCNSSIVADPSLAPPCTASRIGGTNDVQTGASSVVSGDDAVFTDFNHNSLLRSNGSGWSIWIDTGIIEGGTGSATISFLWSLDGFLQIWIPTPSPECTTNGVTADFSLRAMTDTGTPLLTSDSLDSCTQNATLDINRSGSFSLDVTYGVPFAFGLGLFAAADSAVADFSHTAFLTSIVLPAGASFSSGSGTVYSTATSTPVPEPSSMLLLGTGTALLAKRFRRGKYRRDFCEFFL